MEYDPKYGRMSIALWINLTVAIIISLIGFYKTFVKWFKQKLESGFPVNQLLFGMIRLDRPCCSRLPLKVVGLVLYVFVASNLLVDIIDMLTDTLYFTKLESGELLDSRIKVDDYVFNVMFSFLIFGTIKLVLVIKIMYQLDTKMV